MKDIIQKRSELLVSNWSIIHKAFCFEDNLVKTIAAASFAEKDKTADVELIKDCRKLLREKQGIFSDFRGENEVIVSTKMALSGNPEKYLDEIIEVYKLLQKGKFFSSSYRILSAMSVCDAGRFSEAEKIVEKTNTLLNGMKKKHPFIATDEDTCFATLLAMTGREVDDLLAELEEAYPYIKKSFALHENSAYSLAQILTIHKGSIEDKRDKVLDIYDTFKAKGAPYGKEFELASLGALLDIDADKDELVSEIIEVSEFLKGHKGFGMLDMSKHTKLMIGTMIIAGAYSSDNLNTESIVGNTITGLITEQIAMAALYTVIITSSVVAASSSN
ncbi:MAG: DUF4003 domain-containing protein [Butyrivibrio sp.]|nr:DUF4003 domain-containing protein [Butyrivibrio sp.]